MGEILPAKIRGSAASVATAFNWTCTFVVTKTFIDMIGMSMTFVDYNFNNLNLNFSCHWKSWSFLVLWRHLYDWIGLFYFLCS